jgi:hypothetical protein
MSEFDAKVLAAAKALNYADSGGIGTYEWNHFENGDRCPDTMRHIRRYVQKAETVLKAAE